MGLVMDAAALNAFLASDFPQVEGYCVLHAGPTGVTMRLDTGDDHVRPGGTVSGPTMFALADLAIYMLILSRLGPVALAVTTNASIDFMRKPPAGAVLLAEARLLKLGRRLAVADVLIRAEGDADPLARASMTYAIPPKTP